MSVDLLLVSLGTTRGLRIQDAQFAGLAREAGASVAVTGVRIGATDRLRRGYPVNDIVEGIAARRALEAVLPTHAPRALVFSTTTAALLARDHGLPFAVWMDSPARLNRPGIRNAALHALERRRLAAARLVLVLSAPAAGALPPGAAPAVVISPPVAPAPPRTAASEALAVAYVPDPKAKGLELLVRAWAQRRDGDAQLVICGIEPANARGFLERRGLPVPAGVQLVGMLAPDAFGALLLRTRAFVSAAAWEDFGQAPLQALDHGAALVCAPGGGPFPALAIARDLEPAFVAADRSPAALAAVISAGLAVDEGRLVAYAEAARERLAPFRHAEQVRRMREIVLPALLDA